MGLGKWQHIEAPGKLPSVDRGSARWQAGHKCRPARDDGQPDNEAIYAAIIAAANR